MNLKPIASNMTEIEVGNKRVLFSYKTPVAFIDEFGRQFITSKKWSATTTRHINKWVNRSNTWENKPQEYFDNLLNEVK